MPDPSRARAPDAPPDGVRPRSDTLASVKAHYNGPVELVDPGFEATID